MKYLKLGIIPLTMGLIILISSCSDDDRLDFTGNLVTTDQVVAQNNVYIEQISIDRPGWVVVHSDDNGTPGEIISYPVYINSAGSYTHNYIPLDSTSVLTDSMEVHIILYYDEGTLGVFNSEDVPVEVNDETVSISVILLAPSVSVNNQPVVNNTVVIDEIVTGVRSWLAVYQVDQTGSIGDLVGFEAVNESPLNNLEVQLTDTIEYVTDNRLAAILHLNYAPQEQFQFPGNDVPLVFGFDDNNQVFDSFVIQ